MYLHICATFCTHTTLSRSAVNTSSNLITIFATSNLTAGWDVQLSNAVQGMSVVASILSGKVVIAGGTCVFIGPVFLLSDES